jgi:hypothetical protein
MDLHGLLRDGFTSLHVYVDNVHTSQETRPWALTAGHMDNFALVWNRPLLRSTKSITSFWGPLDSLETPRLFSNHQLHEHVKHDGLRMSIMFSEREMGRFCVIT